MSLLTLSNCQRTIFECYFIHFLDSLLLSLEKFGSGYFDITLDTIIESILKIYSLHFEIRKVA